MLIKEVKLRRVYNLGNCESLGIELVADVLPEDDVQTALCKLNIEAYNYKESLDQ